MVEFDLWKESLIFALVYAIVISVPCVLVVLIGRKLIDQLGHFPSKTPAIQMSILFQLIAVEVGTFTCLIGFYHIFSGK